MSTGKRKKSRNSILRAVFVALSFLLQMGWIVLIVSELNHYSTYISMATNVIASLAVLRLYAKRTNNAYKMPWIMLIIALPVMGLSLYLITEVTISPKRVYRRMKDIRRDNGRYLPQSQAVMAQLEEKNLAAANQCRYLWNQEGCPVYTNTQAVYYGDCAQTLEDMKRDFEKAERFIFLEFFIVCDGSSFQELREILVRKAAQGVDVRLIYDDIGSIGKVNMEFARELNRQGIQCLVFNPARPLLSLFVNNRDHRKIAVVDGKIGYTGGFNLADEYFGRAFPYGAWKDTGLRLEGEAVRSLTATFLECWTFTSRSQRDAAPYLDITYSVPADGYVQPFGDSPLDEELTAENVYLNLIGHAEKYVWFMTPYLIITDEMSRALELAAKRGVDVRIITPGIPDKKTVYAVTRSYYAGLVRHGVRIFEYTPGFCHGKQCLCDGKMASIGTSNLDYRSLYLHFENNVLLYDCPALGQMKADFDETLAQCREVTASYRSAPLRIWQCFLRLFAPMM